MSDPPLKYFCLRFAATKNQGVQTGLVNDGQVWVSRGSVANRDGILVVIVNVFCQRIAGIAIPKRRRHVLAHHPRLSVDLDGMDCPEFGVLKNFQFVHLSITHSKICWRMREHAPQCVAARNSVAVPVCYRSGTLYEQRIPDSSQTQTICSGLP